MDLVIHESESFSPISSPSPVHSSHTSFPIIAVAIIGILATAFLLVGYYIFVIKCCLNWHRIDVLRRFSFSRRSRVHDPLTVQSPATESRGLDQTAIRSIPLFKFKKASEPNDKNNESYECECAVCLNEFLDEEKLRVIPNCGHLFHIDCIDVWLQNNANCPLCRTSISANRDEYLLNFSLNRVLDTNPTNQDPGFDDDDDDNFTGRDEDYVVIEIGSEEQDSSSTNPSLYRIQECPNSGEFLSISPSPVKVFEPRRKGKRLRSNVVCSKGDEFINNREKDEQFAVQPVRRSFSMDSAVDSQLYLAVQDLVQQKIQVTSSEVSPSNEGCSSSSSSRIKRSFFSFGQGRYYSRNAVQVQPLALEK